MLVQKFGGSSLADQTGFRAAAAIIGNAAKKEQVVVVLSAMYGVTDLLETAINEAVEGANFHPVLARIEEKQSGLLSTLQSSGVDCDLSVKFLADLSKRLLSRLEGVALLEQCPPQVRAEVLATGEAFSSHAMSDLLRAEGFAAKWSDTDVLPPANDSFVDSLV